MSTWLTPATWTATILTFDALNTELRDHLNFLKGALDVLTGSTTADTGTTMMLDVRRPAGTDFAYRTRVSGDALDRFTIDAAGKSLWSDGTATADVGLQRNNGYLQIDTETTGAHGVIVNHGVLALQGNVSGLAMVERAIDAPVAAANAATMYLLDNGAGKTQLRIIFSSGSAIVLATQV